MTIDRVIEPQLTPTAGARPVGKAPEIEPLILVVEDEDEIRELISLHLLRQGYRVQECADGRDALNRLLAQRYQLVVLDWMLPELSGLQILKTIRGQNPTNHYPVLMVTARTEPSDIVSGLEAGADDYIPKPFEPSVLLARVKALLRRAELTTSAPDSVNNDPFMLGDLQIRPDVYEVTCKGESLHLTPSEFKLLTTLVAHQGVGPVQCGSGAGSACDSQFDPCEI